MRLLPKFAVAFCAAGLLIAPTASAVEPNEGFATATGPLTAGKPFKASLETLNDVDFQFFYLPNTTQMSITTFNTTKKRGGAADRGRTIVSSLLRARKGKLPLPLVGTERTLGPGDEATLDINLVPGKYFIPVGHAANSAEPLGDVPFRIRIGPIGSTTDSFEVFERRCNDSLRRVERLKAGKKRAAQKLEQAKDDNESKGEINDLKDKVSSKRAKVREAQRIKRIVCSVPM